MWRGQALDGVVRKYEAEGWNVSDCAAHLLLLFTLVSLFGYLYVVPLFLFWVDRLFPYVTFTKIYPAPGLVVLSVPEYLLLRLLLAK